MLWWQGGRYHAWALNDLGAFWVGSEGSLLATDGDRVRLGRVEKDTAWGSFSLPLRVATRAVVPGRDGDYWLGTDAGTFHYQPSAFPPRTFIDTEDTRVRQDALWRVGLRAVQRYQAAAPPAGSSLLSWRFDELAWSAFQSFPAQGLSLAGLKPGPHRFEARAHADGPARGGAGPPGPVRRATRSP